MAHKRPSLIVAIMPIRRVILAKTKTFAKGSAKGERASIRKYLQRYMDVVEKQLVKHGEFGEKPKQGEELRHLAEDETSGVLHTGGFFGRDKSPGHPERNKQKGWISRLSEIWTNELRLNPKRTNDGVRFVLSLAPRAVGDLTESGRSPHQALLDIWETTIRLYRARHGWQKPEDELSWVLGAHDDTDNYHFHIAIFPTTKSGKNLKLSDNRGSKGRGNDLSEFIAIANIAAEIYWRENLGLHYQDPDYQKAVSINPTEEPPLPAYDDYLAGRAVVEARSTERPKPPEINTSVIAREMLPDLMIAIGAKPPLRKSKRKGLSRLKSLVCASLKFGKLDWAGRRLMELTGSPSKAIAALNEKFEGEKEVIHKLGQNLAKSPHKPTSMLGKALQEDKYETAHAMLSLILGQEDDPDRQTLATEGTKLAKAYQAASEQPQAAIEVIPLAQGTFRKLSIRLKVSTQRYRDALRSFISRTITGSDGSTKTTMELLSTLIRGAERLSQMADATIDEMGETTRPGPDGKPVVNLTNNEWNIVGGKMVLKRGKSLPWPLHFDPATVFAPLEHTKPEIRQSTIDQSSPDKPETRLEAAHETEGILKRIVRIIQPRELARRRMERQLSLSRENRDL